MGLYCLSVDLGNQTGIQLVLLRLYLDHFIKSYFFKLKSFMADWLVTPRDKKEYLNT